MHDCSCIAEHKPGTAHTFTTKASQAARTWPPSPARDSTRGSAAAVLAFPATAGPARADDAGRAVAPRSFASFSLISSIQSRTADNASDCSSACAFICACKCIIVSILIVSLSCQEFAYLRRVGSGSCALQTSVSERRRLETWERRHEKLISIRLLNSILHRQEIKLGLWFAGQFLL